MCWRPGTILGERPRRDQTRLRRRHGLAGACQTWGARCCTAGDCPYPEGSPALPVCRSVLLAAPIAYEQPTINSSWQAFLLHVPPIALIWVLTLILNLVGIGFGMVVGELGVGALGVFGDTRQTVSTLINQIAQTPFTVMSSFVGVLFTAIPALYYEKGASVTVDEAFRTLFQRPWRYLLAGLLAVLVMSVGFLLCILPGIAVALVMPVYINRVFNTDQAIFDAFGASFRAVYQHPNGWSFILTQVLAWLLVIVVSICTCLVGGLVAGPMATFYVQNAAYRLGILH